MKNWINKKTNQVTILLVGLQVLLVFNFIVPPHEQLRYFDVKIGTLKKEKVLLTRYDLHMRFHDDNYDSIRQRLDDMQKQMAYYRDSSTIQIHLGKLQRKHHLKVITQKLETSKSEDFFDQVVIWQSLEGNYMDQVGYFRDLLQPENTMLVKKCSIKNMVPTGKNPVLHSDLEIVYYLPLI